MTVEAQIRELAQQHGITAQRLAVDDWADAIARVSDAECVQDEIDDLLVNLARAGCISGHRMLELLVAYMHEGETLEPAH
jgi:hypothetical protein